MVLMIFCFIIILGTQLIDVLVFVPIFPGRQIQRNKSGRVPAYVWLNRELQKPKINLSWGMNEKSSYAPSKQEGDVVPATITATKHVNESQHKQNINNIKVLTESSEGEQEELTKLIKNQNDRKMEKEALELFYNRKAKGQQLGFRAKSLSKHNVQQRDSKAVEIDKRIRYLENSLLPSCRRDNMATIFDYNLNKEVPLNQSRLSGKSIVNSKRNQSSVVLGNGYNVFTAVQQPEKDHLQRLQQMYQYQQKYKRRVEQSHFKLG